MAPLGELPVASLPISIDAGTGGTAYIQVASTAAWPTGQMRCDLCLSRSGLTLYSDTFAIYVQPAVTPPVVAP